MDPPKTHDGQSAMSFIRKVILTSKVLVSNSIFVLGLIFIGYVFLEQQTSINIAKKLLLVISHHGLLAPFNSRQMFFVFWAFGIETAIREEFIFRYPFLLLVRNNFILSAKNKNYTPHFLIFTAIGLNLVWSIGFRPVITGHTYFLPVFIAGLPIYWLTYKTRVLWPAITCHTLSNFGLYIFVQLIMKFNDGFLGEIFREAQKALYKL